MKPIPTAFLLFALGCEEEKPAEQINYERVLADVPEPPTPEQVYQNNLEKAVAVATKAVADTKPELDYHPNTVVERDSSMNIEGVEALVKSRYFLPPEKESQFTLTATVYLPVDTDVYTFSFSSAQFSAMMKDSPTDQRTLTVEMKKKGSYDDSLALVQDYSFMGLEKGVQSDFNTTRTELGGTRHKSDNYDAGCTPPAYQVFLSENQAGSFEGREGTGTTYACVTNRTLSAAEKKLPKLKEQIILLYMRSESLLKRKR